MPEETRQIGLRLPLDLIEWLQARARAEDRPMAYVARRILAERKAAEERAKKRTGR
jgi:hypothetical protein